MNVYRDGNKFSSSVHRKDTFSGVFTSFNAFMPEVYKKGLISTLLYRAFMINSSMITLHSEVEKLKVIFRKNGYPSSFIDRCIFRFFNKIYEKKTPVHTVPKKEVTIMLPFMGTTSLRVKNSLTRSFRNIMPFCNVKFIFKTTNRISSFFTYKDMFPKSLLSGVIYHYTCARCKLSYVGCTKRYWEKRLEEHTHISARTGEPLNGQQVFTPKKHQRTCKGKTSGFSDVSRNDFKIIGREKDPYLLQVKESIFIINMNPELNGRETSVPIYLFT